MLYFLCQSQIIAKATGEPEVDELKLPTDISPITYFSALPLGSSTRPSPPLTSHSQSSTSPSSSASLQSMSPCVEAGLHARMLRVPGGSLALPQTHPGQQITPYQSSRPPPA